MNRFYVDPSAIGESRAVITGDDVAHISKVLRLKIGDSIALCDGKGNQWTAEISEITKKEVTVTLGERTDMETEPRCKITLYQGIQKAGKLETVIQKGVELGVCAFVPFDCERAVAKPWSGEDAKQERYQRVALEAAKQCGRGVLPTVEAPIGFDALCKRLKNHQKAILFWEEETQRSLKDALRTGERFEDVAVVIGPEGGISPREAMMLADAGAVSVSLGKRILRTETAGPAAAAMILYEQDDMNP